VAPEERWPNIVNLCVMTAFEGSHQTRYMGFLASFPVDSWDLSLGRNRQPPSA
jgi:hypothetical protein